MTGGRRVLIGVAVAASLGLVASPAAAKGTATVPGAPTITSITVGATGATIAFTAPSDTGGSAILQYRARCKPAGPGETKAGYARKSPILVNGLSGTRSYSCKASGRNRAGFGAASNAFNVSGGSSGGTTCRTGSGTVVFKPALPKITDHTLVNDVRVLSGTIGSCDGGGVTSGKTEAAIGPSSGSNCTVLATDGTSVIVGSLLVTWNTGKGSSISIRLHAVKGKPTHPELTGTVIKGLFKGKHLTATINYRLPAGACTTAELSTATYTQSEPWIIS